MNLLQMEYDLLPVRVLKEDKIAYIQALVDTRNTEDIGIFVDSMTQLHIEHLRSDIDKFLKTTEEEISDRRKETIQKNVVESSQKSSQKTTQKITQKTTQKIIELIRNYPEITQKELAQKCDISSEGIKWQLKKLKRQGVVRRVGPDKGGHWELLQQP